MTIGGVLASGPAAHADAVNSQRMPSAPIEDGAQAAAAGPAADIYRAPSAPTVPVGTVISYDSAVTGSGPFMYVWSIDGSVREGGPTASTFTRTFSTPGTHTVELTFTDGSGQSTTAADTFTVYDPAAAPDARFTQTPAGPTVTNGTEVTFDGTSSSGDQLQYFWFVRGERGVVSRDPVLKYTFKKPGSYGVQLVVRDSKNQVSAEWTGLDVVAGSEAPVARFSQTPSSSTLAAPAKVTFDGTGSTGDQLKYAWYVRGQAGVVSTDPVLNWNFQYPGDYGVQLVVTDSIGRQAKQWVGLTVTGTNRQPIADFTQDPPGSGVPDGSAPVTFDGTKSYDPDGDQLQYYWYVRGEPGVVSTDPILKWKFKGPGDYGVQLVVVDPSGASAKKWVSIGVYTT